MTAPIDNSYTFETPEGVEIELTPAGPLARILAYFIDTLIRGAIQTVLAIGLHLSLGQLGSGLFLLSVFLLEWFYPVFFECMNGQTPGKKSMKLSVVHADGTPINFSRSLTRNLLRTVDFLPFGYLFGLGSICLNKRFQRIGDILANTVVVYQDPPLVVESKHDDAPIALTTPLSQAEQQAIIQFSLRADSLSEGRQQELASILDSSLLEGSARPIADLHGIANGLLGQTHQ